MGTIPAEYSRDKTMNAITMQDGTRIYYKDWGTGQPVVFSLVYVAAFAPDEGESLADIESNSKDSVLLPALVELRYPTGQGSETAVEFAVKPENLHDANDHT